MSEPIVFLNGEFVPASQAKLNIYDLGIVLGATFTEMTRTFNHGMFKAEEHVQRLFASLRYGNIPIPYSPEQILDFTGQLVEHNAQLIEAGQELAIAHFVTPGENRLYAGAAAGSGKLSPTICIHSFPLPFTAWRHLMTDGAHVVTPSIRHIPPQCLDPKTKNRSRLHWWLADQETHNVDPKAITLLLDLEGNITECAGSNFVIVKNGIVYSPTSRNILGGISLGYVRELCVKLQIEWVEKDLQIYDVINADEAWLTTTPYCVAPCTRINGKTIADGRIGSIYEKVLAAWSDKVGLDIRAQILNSTY